MRRAQPRSDHIKLSRDAYEELRFKVLRRDGWRCQGCGRCENLQIQHKELRSYQRSDTDDTVCFLSFRKHGS